MKGIKTVLAMVLAIGLFAFAAAPALAEDGPSRDECVAMCKRAGEVFQEVGAEEGLKRVQDANGEFVSENTYVFVLNLDSTTVAAHPITPGVVGKSLMAVKDVNGEQFFAEFISVAKSPGEGWVEYMWPKPGEKTASPKVSYVYKVPGAPYAAIAGIYE